MDMTADKSRRFIAPDTAEFYEQHGLLGPMGNNKQEIFTAATTSAPIYPSRAPAPAPSRVSSASFSATFETKTVDAVEIPAVLEVKRRMSI